jgi:enoyl-[acyl-carrier protein] reductase II
VAHENFKKAFLRAGARDAMPTVQVDPNFPVIPVRALQNKGTEEFMMTQRRVIEKFNAGGVEKLDAQLEIEHFWAGALRRAAIDGDVEYGSLMAGQSVGMVTKEQPVLEILEELVDQAVSVLDARLSAE